MDPQQRRTAKLALGLIFVGYASARALEIVPNPIPRTAIVALDVLSAMTFACVDGARHYRWRGMLMFAGICTVVANIIENIGVATGFPFGRYQFIELMGPKLFQVPVLLGLAYIGMAYVSWRLAHIILGNGPTSSHRARILAMPLVASFIMVAWDLAQDPVWATVLQGWIWYDGGPWFGVPVSNYLGWYLTEFLIFVCFAAYLSRRPPASAGTPPAPQWPPVLFYAICALANVMQVFTPSAVAVVHDPTGKPWRVADITAASALVSVFVMGAFALTAAMRLVQRIQTPPTVARD